VRLTLAGVLGLTPGNTARRQQQQQVLPLPVPISPLAAAEADSDPFCAESAALQQYATSSTGWTWGNPIDLQSSCPHPNCNTFGFYASGAGQTLQLTIDTQNSAIVTNGATLDRANLVAIYSSAHLAKWAGRIGVGMMTCVSGCSCQPVLLTRPAPAFLGGKLVFAKTEVSVAVGVGVKCTL
jgi:hypothetical protein